MSFLLYAFVLPKLPFVVYHRTRNREQTDRPTGFIESDPDIELNHNHTEASDKLDADQISESHQLQVRQILDCFYSYITSYSRALSLSQLVHSLRIVIVS